MDRARALCNEFLEGQWCYYLSCLCHRFVDTGQQWIDLIEGKEIHLNGE